MIERYALLAATSYLIGSIPFGLYAARRSLTKSPANYSANVAPPDLYRRSALDRRVARLAFCLELVKGFVPALAGYLTLGAAGAVGGGSAALVGHNFPLFTCLQGSSSLAPLLRVLLAVYPVVVVILAMVWIAALAALDVGGSHENLVIAAAVLWSLLVFFAHRENIRRLLSGREAMVNAAPSQRSGVSRSRRVQ